MLRTKLFAAFVALVAVLGLVSGVIGIRIIKRQVIGEAQKRVRMDVAGAWSVVDGVRREVETTLRLAADGPSVVEPAAAGRWDSEELHGRLASVRRNFGLDFLSLTDPSGTVVARADGSRSNGDSRLSDPMVADALKGKAVFAPALLNGTELERETAGLAERAFIVIEPTLHARPNPRTEEDRGMVLMGAVPVMKGPQLCGVLYGGVLLNRNHAMADRIRGLVYRDESSDGTPVGAATIFLHDCRIATTIRSEGGNRAIGTRVSKEVADRVLDNGLPWVGRAFVVREWYLTTYEPIRNLAGEVIGMLYVGILEKPFRQMEREFILQYAGLLVFGLVVASTLAFFMAHRLSRPIHLLVEATQRVTDEGEHPTVQARGGCHEIEMLIESFNQMTVALGERRRRIREANAELQATNESLATLNTSYMDMLGFVSHELKVPVASIQNYLFLLDQQKIGALTEKQGQAVRAIERNIGRMTEMIRHYLNLSRIENGELQPNTTAVRVLPEALKPVLDAFAADAEVQVLRLVQSVAGDLAVQADPGMLREVFDNLIGNAIKYGRRETTIEVNVRARNGMVEFAVRNEGEGIPPDQQRTIFDKFTRLERHARSDHRGTGLGLFITKYIVEAHGGKIEVESEPGAWTEFRFTLPPAPPPA